MPDRTKANSGLNHFHTQLQLQLLPLLLHRTLVVLPSQNKDATTTHPHPKP